MPNGTTHPRPPVVVIVGHVDHGKTTLLDYIKKTNVAAREAGGITQAVSAYEITHNGHRITFIDTPGHEAFSNMRNRGANIADLAILVVAAEEGLKPQTKEAIQILWDTKTPFIVALNKIDKPEANIEKVKNELTAFGVLLEGYGGQISWQGVSAKTGEGVNDLLDHILLAAEVEGFSYDPAAPASGYILEARMDRQRGLEATVILKNGTLSQGSPISTKTAKGKVKILEDFSGTARKELTPSAPARVLGFESLPGIGEAFTAGETITEAPTERAANSVSQGKEGVQAFILKANDAGSLEAFSQIMRAMGEDKGFIVIAESIGDVSDGDIKLAIASKAAILAYKVKASTAAKTLAEANKVTILSSEIIYKLVEAVEVFITAPETIVAGELEILAVFNLKKLEKQVVGGKVLKGTMRNKAPFEIVRGSEFIGRGRIVGIEEQKKEVNHVPEGKECGLLVNAGVAIAVGDHIVIR